MKNRKIPITRINKWYSREDFELDVGMGRECVEGDGNQVIILYQVDRGASETDALYGEAQQSEIRYKTPVELKVVAKLEEPENKNYNAGSGGLRFLQDGNLIFGIYEQQLEELNVNLSYGDYIGYAVTEIEMRFYTIANVGEKIYDNKHTIMGYKGAYRTVVCVPVDDNEFNAL